MPIPHRSLIPLLVVLAAVGGCTADVEDEGALPDVEVEGGALPTVDIDPADVNIDISSDTQRVIVPDIDVTADRPDTTRN